ncbi:MAG: hypothetical protein WCO96_01675 [Actinomycetes bacterium]
MAQHCQRVRRGPSDEPNRAGSTDTAESTLVVATALNPLIGHSKAAEISKEASGSARHLREIALELGGEGMTFCEAINLAGSPPEASLNRVLAALAERARQPETAAEAVLASH